MKLDLPEARRIILHSQGLLGIPGGRGPAATLDTIKNLGYVQIDTISVVARAHHHTLWSREKAYSENHLDTLLRTKKIFEYWSHAASYLPMRDYRFSLVRKEIYAKGKTHWFGKLGQDKKLKKHVLDRIRAEGPLQSKDFEHTGKGGGTWYEWKPAKRALEQLFMEGHLMVAGRKGFQKLYDLRERVVPEDVDQRMPGDSEYAAHLILQAVRSQGLINSAEITYLRSHAREAVGKELKKLLKEGKLSAYEIEGAGTYFGDPLEIKRNPVIKAPSSTVHILGPFDNVVIQRKRLQNLFGFDFIIECYVPEPKRKFGYYCLPLLHGERFVARFDPKADRSTGEFHIRKFFPEKNWKADESFAKSFAEKLKSYARFCGCHTIKAGKDTPAVIRKYLK